MAAPAPSDKVKDKEYTNWLKVTLSLYYMKSGLHKFIETEVNCLHQSLINKIYRGSTVPLQSCSVCNAKCLKRNKNTGNWTFQNQCNSYCYDWFDELLKLHVNKKSDRIYWNNSDISSWPLKSWECAKVFMPRGQQPSNVGPAECDAQALMTLLANCKHFDQKLSPNGKGLTHAISKIRNNVMHSCEMKLSDGERQNFIKQIIQLLEDPVILKSEEDCKTAVGQIQKIDNDSVDVFFNVELQMIALKTAVNESRQALGMQEKTTLDTVDSLKEEYRQLRERSEKIEKEMGEKMDTIENDVKVVKKRTDTALEKQEKLAKSMKTLSKNVAGLQEVVGQRSEEISSCRKRKLAQNNGCQGKIRRTQQHGNIELAKVDDGIICVIKLYPDLKSNMTKTSVLAIAKELLDGKMISKDEYERFQDTTKPRRCLTDMLLKKILRVDREKTELFKCFFNQLRLFHPLMATKISQMAVTAADRADFTQVKKYGVKGKNAHMTSQNSHKMTDAEISFFERCLCESPDRVDRINDELLSKFLISIIDHSLINKSDKVISTLFETVQFHNLDIESVLEIVLDQSMLEEWKTLRCEVPLTASLDQVMQDNGNVMKDKEIPNPCSTLESTVVHKETAMGDAKDDGKMTNFCRFFLLVMGPGKLTLQSFLEKQYSAKGDLQLFLKSKEGEVKILCSKRIIKQWQVDILQPTTGDVSAVQNLDISTICILLIYLCQITKPLNGWKELPSNNDQSTGADILRLLHAAENLVFYRKAGDMSALEFNEKWDNIHGAISRLSVQLDEKEIDDIRRRMVLIREESIDPGKEMKINNELFKILLSQMGKNQEMKLGEIITMDVDEVCSNQHNEGSSGILLKWIRCEKNAEMNAFATQFQSNVNDVEKGSILIKLRVWNDLKVELLDKDFVSKRLRILIRRGCFESKIKLRDPVHVTVYILSPEAQGDKDEIHFHLELDSTKHDVKKPRVHLKSQDMKLLVEEMDPIGLQHWIFDQLQIDVNNQKSMNEIVSWQGLSRCDQMEILLDSIKRLENGFDMLEQYCKKNDPYVYNKVFEKPEQLSCPKESDTNQKSIWSSYCKGGGLQKLYSMQLDLDVEEQGKSDLDLEKYWTEDMVTQTEEQEYVYDKKGNTGDKAISETSTQMKQVYDRDKRHFGKLHQTVLTRCLPKLMRALDVKLVCNYIQQKELFDDVTLRDILEHSTTPDKNRELIRQIQQGDQDTYEKFKECLVLAKQSFLKDFLEEEEAQVSIEIKETHEAQGIGKLHQTVLTRCLPKLMRALDVKLVCNYIQQKELFDDVTLRDILDQKTTPDKIVELIRLIQERDHYTYEKFKECLVLANQSDLHCLLEKEEALVSKEIKETHEARGIGDEQKRQVSAASSPVSASASRESNLPMATNTSCLLM